MSELKQGMRVEIYCDPITQLDLEDTAELLFLGSKDQDSGMERWAVKFDDEPEEVYTRNIMP